MKAGKHTRRTMFWAMAAALCLGCLTTLVLLMDVHPAIQPYTPLILGTAVSGLLTVLFSCIVLVKALRKPEQIPEAHSVLDPFSLESILLLILCTIPVWWAICKHHESMPKAAFLRQEPLSQCNVGLYAALLCFLSLESLASLLRRIRSGQLAATSLLAAFFRHRFARKSVPPCMNACMRRSNCRMLAETSCMQPLLLCANGSMHRSHCRIPPSAIGCAGSSTDVRKASGTGKPSAEPVGAASPSPSRQPCTASLPWW